MMNKIAKATAIFLTVWVAYCSSYAGQVPDPPFKTARITYDISFIQLQATEYGFESQGKRIVYIDAVNNKRREEELQRTQQTMNTGRVLEREERILRIHTGDREYTIYWPKTKTANYIDVVGSYYSWVDAEWRTVSTMDYVGEEYLLGKLCQVYEKEGIRIWLWNTITLKREDKDENTKLTIEAISVEEDVRFDDSKFKLPPGVETLERI